MTYIQRVLRDIQKELPDISGGLARYYSLLVLTEGVNTTLANVHDAWAVWQDTTSPAHQAILPFEQLTEEVQELDRKYRDAIVRVSEKYYMNKYMGDTYDV